MGSASSKAAKAAPKAAAAASRRQYPSTSSIMNSASSSAPYPSSQSSSGPPNTTTPTPAPSQVHPDPEKTPPSDTKAEHIDLDGRDPQFASSLRKLGPAVAVENALPNQQKFPTSTQPPIGQQGLNIFPTSPQPPNQAQARHSVPGASAANPSVRIVQARERVNTQYAAEQENLGRSSFGGRTLITAKEISDVLRMSIQEGKSASAIEKQLRLKPGVVHELIATRGVVDNV